MGKGKIAPIRKEYSSTFLTIDGALAKNGYYRAPGTAEMLFPYKEVSGRYRTGLDEDAQYLHRLSKEDREAEVKKIKETKARLEKTLQCDGCLDASSEFYNYSSKGRNGLKVSPIKLGSDDVYFDTNNPMEEIAFYWAKSHPRVAPSLEAYKRGEVPADTKYYVVDDEAENKDTYNKKREINKAIIAFDSLTPTKKKQIARLMGLPVTESTNEEIVYNLVDSILKESEIKEGTHKGHRPVALFNQITALADDKIKIKDLVEQAITHSVYRIGTGAKIMEGSTTIASSKDDLVEYLLDEKNQLDLLALEKKLNIKKIDKL